MKNLAVSISLHTAILASVVLLNFNSDTSKSASAERLPQERQIDVSFVVESSTETVQIAKRTIQKPTNKEPKKITQKQEQTSAKPAQKQVAASKKQVGSDDYKAQVRAWLEQHKTYPRRAKIARMQGEAVVNFTIAADGRVLSTHLTASTGYEILDSATMQAVRASSPFPPFPQDLPKNNMNISVPFAYYLE